MFGKYRKQKRIELDINTIFKEILNHTAIIILSGISTACMFIIITQLFITPVYESKAKLFVLSRNSSKMVTSSDMQSSSSLVLDYIELIQSRRVLERVISDLNLHMTHEELRSLIQIVSTNDTRIIIITVTTEDPYLSADIANEICNAFSVTVQEVTGIEPIHVIEAAEISIYSSSPSLKWNGLIGGVIGILLSSAVIILFRIIDTGIKNRNDVNHYLGLELLGSIPLSQSKKERI